MKECMTLEEASVGRKNNLNIIRLFASLLVLYMHSFAVSIGNETPDLIGKLTLGKELSGGFAVDIFFIISGFLIIRSFDNSKSVAKYFKARFLRIWPLLFVVVIVLAFIVGPAFSTFRMHNYFFNKEFLKFLKNIAFICTSSSLPGVFMNHYSHSINGSLWTLMYEVICYIFVALLAPCWKKRRATAPVLFTVFAIIHFYGSYVNAFSIFFVSSDFILNMARLAMFFSAGMTAYLYRDEIVLSKKYLLGAIVIVAVGILFGDFSICFAIGGAYIVFFIAFQKRFVAGWYDKFGDLSYGIYIMAFPVQQMVVEWFGTVNKKDYLQMNPYLNMVISLLILLPLAWASYKFIEKPCLKLKDKKLLLDRK